MEIKHDIYSSSLLVFHLNSVSEAKVNSTTGLSGQNIRRISSYTNQEVDISPDRTMLSVTNSLLLNHLSQGFLELMFC